MDCPLYRPLSNLLSGNESWTIYMRQVHRLNSFHLQCLIRIMRGPCVEKQIKTNKKTTSWIYQSCEACIPPFCSDDCNYLATYILCEIAPFQKIPSSLPLLDNVKLPFGLLNKNNKHVFLFFTGFLHWHLPSFSQLHYFVLPQCSIFFSK